MTNKNKKEKNLKIFNHVMRHIRSITPPAANMTFNALLFILSHLSNEQDHEIEIRVNHALLTSVKQRRSLLGLLNDELRTVRRFCDEFITGGGSCW